MSIAFKGSGGSSSVNVATTAVAAACPAVVDANDLLVYHVVYRDTTDAPVTPTGWTPLAGPHNIGVTPACRHWVFGKIAVGDEDGAAQSVGVTANAIEKAGRIYSFSGYVAGALGDVVPAASFSATAHDTDPQMPTVITTVAGALAVALVSQADNNALAAAAGMTGGIWAEATAESILALTIGLVLQVQTATPTADPGTITGGAVAAVDDPSGVIGFEIRPNAPVAAPGGTGGLTLLGVGT